MIKTKLDKRTSRNYVGTTKDYKNDPQVLALREEVKNANSMGGNLRVVVRGRKPYAKHQVRDVWTGRVSTRSYDFGGNVVGGLANATLFDVYVYTK